MNNLKHLLALVGLMFLLTGCLNTKLQTNTTMSNSIFLQANNNKSIFLNIKNSKSLNIKPKLINALSAKGYEILKSPNSAGYILNINVVSFDKASKDHIASGASLGGGLGLAVGAYNHSAGTAIAANGLIAAAAGAIIGKMTEDVNYALCVDVQIIEMPNLAGSSAPIAHQSRLIAQANKMNLQKTEAKEVLEDKISAQIAELF